MTTSKKPELLAPAGNLEKLEFAVRYGADAVYIGGQQFGLRAKAGNFSFAEMEKGVAFAHKHGALVYVATNIIPHDADLEGLEEYLTTLESVGVDAIIAADPSIIHTAKSIAPRLEIHLSTQSSTTNWQTAKFWRDEGVKRVVLAREVSLKEIKEIKQHTAVEIETFIHGAMCNSYSGRCVLSNHLTSRDANRGGCAQSCRWQYDLFAEDGELDWSRIADSENVRVNPDIPYTMGSKDLCMIEALPELIEAGVDSFKIEGRMKSIHYVATVVNAYRQAIDAYLADPKGYRFDPRWLEEISRASHRPLTLGFYYNPTTYNDQIYQEGPKVRKFDFAGLILDYDQITKIATIEQRNHFMIGQEVEFFGPKTRFVQRIDRIEDESGTEIDAARHPQQIVKVRVDHPVNPFDMMRKEN